MRSVPERTHTPVFTLAALLALLVACGNRRTTPAAVDAPDASGIRVHFPGPLPTPSPANPGAHETDVPITWLYLPEDPAPTGSAPDVVVGAMVPCGYRPVYGSVSPPVSPLAVRLHVSQIADAGACTDGTLMVQRISLQRLRVGDYDVTDAVPRRPGEDAAPRARLRVAPDDASLPALAARRFRGCTVGADASCAAGGVCARADDEHHGVCVPPLDPELAAGGPCASGTVQAALRHGASTVRACLPACNETGGCEPGFACARLTSGGVCVPRP